MTNHFHHYSIRHAFSLVEMLFVLLVIGVLAGVGINYVQQQTLKQKMSITIEQLQALSVAARNYYESTGTQWPASLNELSPFMAKSVSQQGWVNPFGYPLSLPPSAATQPYYVATTVPDYSIAKRIAARLPMTLARQATTINPDNQPALLRMYLTTPSPIAWQGADLGAKVLSIDVANISNQRDYSIQSQSCPAGMEFHWAAGLRSFSKARSAGNWEYISGVTLCSQQSTSPDCQGRKPVFSDQLRLRATAMGGDYDVDAQAMILRYCQPKTG